MATNGIRNLNYDGSSSRIRWHMSAFGGMTALKLPKSTKKYEAVTLLGDVYASVYTPGLIEMDKAEAKFTAVGWKEMLAKLPDNYMDIEFPITTIEKHVTVTSSYSTILDRCQFVEIDPGTIENTEKGRIITVSMRVALMHERGADGIWKTPGRRPGEKPEASPAARALMF